MDKKSQILEAAMRCFSQKGYRATSIQEIADTLGIAKGSLYFYFKSKEDLLASIIKQYIDKMMDEFWAIVRDESLPARERLYRQQVQSFRYYQNNKDFIRLLMQERLDLHDQLFELVYSVRYQTLSGIQQLLTDIYGEASVPYSVDAATVYIAMSNEYMTYMILDQGWVELDEERLARHLLNWLDDVMQGMLKRGEDPLLRPEKLLAMAEARDMHKPLWKKEALTELQTIRSLLESSGLAAETLDEMISSTVTIEEEIERDLPRPVVVKGLIALLKKVKKAEIKKHIARLEQLLAHRPYA